MKEVAIMRIAGGDIRGAVRRAVELIGGIGRYLRPGDRVLVKPNLVGPLGWRTGAITNPEVTAALVEMAREAGAGEVLIAEGPTIGLDVPTVFEATGYRELAARLRVPLVDLNSAQGVVVKVPRGIALKSVRVSRPALEVDALINVPVMKTHNQTTVTLALKNMKGVLSPEGKRKDHFVGLDQAIADMNTVLKQSLVVVDGVIGQERNGPVLGDPVALGLEKASPPKASSTSRGRRPMGGDPCATSAYSGSRSRPCAGPLSRFPWIWARTTPG